MKPPSQRQLRVGEVIRQAVSELLLRQEIYHPRLNDLSITVSGVRVSPDMKNATVYVTPLGQSLEVAEGVCKALNEKSGEIRRHVSKRIYMRFSPRLYFKPDESFENAGRVQEILNSPKVKRDLEAVDDNN